MDLIPEELLARLRLRCADPRLRTDAAHLNSGTSFGGAFETVVIGVAGSPPESAPPLSPPAATADLAAAETDLGLELPDDLKQLYSNVADGGFGPSGGLASLKDITDRYRQMTASPPGEGGQVWPRQLLPIGLSDPGADCYDLESGRIVYWDEESLDGGPSDLVWNSSFKPQAESLSRWLEDWMALPAEAERAAQAVNESAVTHLRTALPVLRGMTSEEREAIGMSGDDWEAALCRRLGVDSADL